jgi:hypothetical protein
MSIDEQVSQAMEQWDKETNCGETDPAFQGEVDEEINKLVDGLKQDDVDKLMRVDKPIIFVEEEPAEGFTLTCNKCGRSVNINLNNVKDYLVAYGWGVKQETLEKFTDNKLCIFSIEDETGTTITCPCGNVIVEY